MAWSWLAGDTGCCRVLVDLPSAVRAAPEAPPTGGSGIGDHCDFLIFTLYLSSPKLLRKVLDLPLSYPREWGLEPLVAAEDWAYCPSKSRVLVIRAGDKLGCSWVLCTKGPISSIPQVSAPFVTDKLQNPHLLPWGSCLYFLAGIF